MTLKPHSINDSDYFIAGWYLRDPSVCDELIRYHGDSPFKREGAMAIGAKGTVDKSMKDSIDVTLEPGDLKKRYVGMLVEVAAQYAEKFPFANEVVPWGITEPMGIQHYAPGGGYKVWHFERSNINPSNSRRHLAFMTYLNEVDDAGGTEFYHQRLSFRPEKGLTLVWPADWTYTHRGIVSPSQHKYIVTGWFSTYTQQQYEGLQKRYETSF